MNKNRHYWKAGKRLPDNSLLSECVNCGLQHRVYQSDRYRADYLNPTGEVLPFERAPECPKERGKWGS